MMDLATSGIVAALLIAAGSVYHIFTRRELVDGVVPLIVALASVVLLFFYAVLMSASIVEGRRSGRTRAVNFGMMLPWALASFVVAYWGIWGLVSLFMSGFDWLRLVGSAAWLLIGYRLMHRTWLLTEVTDAHRRGKLVVAASTPSAQS